MRAPCWGTMTCEKKPSVPHVRVLLGALALFSLLPGCRWQGVTAPPGAAAGIRFVDATGAAGIHFRHTHGGYGKKLLPETVGSGVAWLDYDGDGWQDLLFVNCKPLRNSAPQPPSHTNPKSKIQNPKFPTPALYR